MIIQMEEGRRVFSLVVERVSKLSLFYQILEYQETRLQLSAFRLEKLLPERALQTYQRVMSKHMHSSELCPRPDAWYESEKRLFAWFMAFHSYLERDGQSIKNEHDFAALSRVFFMKDVDFLEFHWLVMVRSSEKVGWEEKQEALLLTAISEFGLKWNEVSRSLFTQTGKALFRAPKVCRERWLNHLDYSKVKGNWTVQQDIAIFSYVVEEGKRWSRLVGVLGGKRTEHTIKNRFNAMVSKHRRYKFEKDVKVAIRILEQLRKEPPREQVQERDSRFKEENISPQASIKEKDVSVRQKIELKCEEAGLQQARKIEMEPCPQQAQLKQSEQHVQIQVKHEQAIDQPKGDQVRDVVYPFQNYSYEWQIYNQTCFQHTQLLYYQQMMALPVPTADTTSREAKILEQRRRRRERQEE